MLVALGTHPPMPSDRIEELLGIGDGELSSLYANVGLFNHEWDRPDRLTTLGHLTEDDTAAISGGLLRENVPVQINSRIHDYKQ